MTGPGGRCSDAARCAECGFDDEALDPAAIPAALRSFTKRYRAPLSRFLPGEDGDALVRQRPAEGTWSALEYAAHVRDVFASYDRWIGRCLTEDRPVLDDPPPDNGAYNQEQPAAVADAVAANAERLAATVEAVPADAWDRVGVRGDEERSVRFTAGRAVHEGSHHLLDIGRGLRAVRDQRKAAT
jgi:hypothetical protein